MNILFRPQPKAAIAQPLYLVQPALPMPCLPVSNDGSNDMGHPVGADACSVQPTAGEEPRRG